MGRRLVYTVIVILLAVLAACRAPVRRFPLAPPLWQDPDANHILSLPAEHYSGLVGDAMDHTVFRQMSDLFAFNNPGEALNANALDEVPNSSWFANRIGMFPITPAQVARGGCEAPPLDPTRGPWTVTKAKTEGITPGMFIKAPDGHRYLLKFDGPFRPQRGSAADAIGARLYWSAGYNVPCNEVVYFRRQILRIGSGATALDGRGYKRPLTRSDMESVLSKAFRLKDGRLRVLASRFLPGKPIGPFLYEGVRSDDPNDVIPHEDRREIRASRLLAAWINHFDIRGQNSLDMVVQQGKRRFVRHYQMDFGDAFGNLWPDDRLNRRVGHTYWMDIGDLLLDLLSLGTISRPWFQQVPAGQPDIFSFYGWRDFKPSRWKPVYPNPAFARMTHRDALWMIRIISRISDAHLEAIVRAGRLTDPRDHRYLLRALIARRDLILAEYLNRYNPLARFRLVRRTPGKAEQSLCFEDLAIRHAGMPHDRVVYKLRMLAGPRLDRQLGWLQFSPDPEHPHRSCVLLPIGDSRPDDLVSASAPDDHPLRYGVLRIYVFKLPSQRPTSIELHLVDRGPRRGGYVLVGIDRPPRPELEDLHL